MSEKTTISYDEIIAWLHQSGRKEKVLLKRKRFGIHAKNALGVYHYDLKEKAREIGYNSELAVQLFDSGIYEARILCSKIFDPKELTLAVAEKWLRTFENWEICDSFSISLFAKSDFAVTAITKWVLHKREFEKRAGFATMSAYCMANKEADNDVFESFLLLVQEAACDEREYVKKSVNWALRCIGKRNIDLNKSAITMAYQIIQYGAPSAKWVGNNALKELQRSSLRISNYPRKIYAPDGKK